MPTINENIRMWNAEYSWNRHGDEWDDQAAFCHQPYKKWKESIVDIFINENINDNSAVLEIAPGHGRWTEFIVKKAKRVILVDVSPKCIDYCKDRFSEFKNVTYCVNDGRRLHCVEDDSIDFAWSYDSFVHMERDVIESYFSEFSRILKPNSRAIIHHAGRRDLTLCLGFLQKLGRPGKFLYQIISFGRTRGLHGSRSNISKELIARIAEKNGLVVEAQVDSWGEDSKYNVRLFGDYISTLRNE